MEQLSFEVGDASLRFLSKRLGSVKKHTWAARVHGFQKLGPWNLVWEEAI